MTNAELVAALAAYPDTDQVFLVAEEGEAFIVAPLGHLEMDDFGEGSCVCLVGKADDT